MMSLQSPPLPQWERACLSDGIARPAEKLNGRDVVPLQVPLFPSVVFAHGSHNFHSTQLFGSILVLFCYCYSPSLWVVHVVTFIPCTLTMSCPPPTLPMMMLLMSLYRPAAPAALLHGSYGSNTRVAETERERECQRRRKEENT